MMQQILGTLKEQKNILEIIYRYRIMGNIKNKHH